MVLEVPLAAGADANDQSALKTAAADGRLDIVEVLLATEANVNGPVSGPPCVAVMLEMAAEGGHLDAIQALLATRVDIDQY